MSDAVGQILVLAVAVAVSPFPIIGVVVMLGSRRARVNGPAFLVGWLVGLAVAGGLVLLIVAGSGADDGGEAADWLDALRLIVGVVAIAAAWKGWRGRPGPGEEAPTPAWMKAADEFTPQRAAALGVALAAVNPKNLLLVVSAAAAIGQTGASTAAQVGALAIFMVVASIGCGAPVILYLALGERSERVLADIRGWMAANNAAIMTVILLLIGAKLIGDAISGLAV